MDRRPEYQVHRIDLSQASPAGGLTIDGQFGVFRFFRAEDAVAAEVADALVSVNVQGTATGDEFPLKVGDAIFCPNVRRIRLIWAAQASVKWAYFLSSAGREEMEIDARPKLQLIAGEIDAALAMVDTLAERTFFGGLSVSAEAAKYGHIQLLNPAASGVNVYLTKVHFMHSSAGIEFKRYATALANNSTAAGNKKIAGAAPAATLNFDRQAVVPGTALFSVKGTAGAMQSLDWRSDPVKLEEAQGVMVVHGVVNELCNVAYEWTERPV